MLNSHNSYWINGDPVKISCNYGCDIIEADLIDKDLNLSHSWRPSKSMYYGNLVDRYLKNFPLNKYLYLEFKTGDIKIIEPLYKALKKSGIKKIIINASYHPIIERVKVMNEFHKTYGKELGLIKFESFEKIVKVDNIDLYKFSLLHF